MKKHDFQKLSKKCPAFYRLGPEPVCGLIHYKYVNCSPNKCVFYYWHKKKEKIQTEELLTTTININA